MEVSTAEAEKIWTGKCPCGGALMAGPKGGAAMNVKCGSCGAEFNIPPRPWQPEIIKINQNHSTCSVEGICTKQLNSPL